MCLDCGGLSTHDRPDWLTYNTPDRGIPVMRVLCEYCGYTLQAIVCNASDTAPKTMVEALAYCRLIHEDPMGFLDTVAELVAGEDSGPR